MPYNSQLYSRCVAILFLAVVALFEEIQCSRFLIIILVSLKQHFHVAMYYLATIV
jgi:hypothetical protein